MIAFYCGIEITAVELYGRHIKIKIVKVRFYFDSSLSASDGSRTLKPDYAAAHYDLSITLKELERTATITLAHFVIL